MPRKSELDHKLGAALFDIVIKNIPDSSKLTTSREDLCKYIEKHPWNLMQARDPETDIPIIHTRDELDSERPYKPIPNKPYLRALTHLFWTEPFLIVHKTRQMMVTIISMQVAMHEILTIPARRTIFSKVIEEEAIDILQDKIRDCWLKTPPWFQNRYPITLTPRRLITATKSRSFVKAAAMNAASRECRGHTATRVVIDEAAFQDNTQDIVEAAGAMSKYIDIITTPMANTIGGRFVKELIYGREAIGE